MSTTLLGEILWYKKWWCGDQVIRSGDVTAVLTEGYHTGSEMLFPCLPQYHDISEVETNCIILYGLI